MSVAARTPAARGSLFSRVVARLDAYERLVRLDKPIGTLLLLWPTLAALWIAARGAPTWLLVGIFVMGTILMRSAGCAINDFADRNFDAHVERTANRPLARGEIAPWEALALAAALALCALLLLIPLNTATKLLAIPALAIAVAYPFFKRFFALPQAFLGVAFSFGIPMAYAAVLGEVTTTGWLLFGANLLWVMAYDTEYAMVDRDDDRRLGLKTSAITFGRGDVLAVMICYALYLASMSAIGARAQMGFAFDAGVLVAALIALHHYVLIRGRDRARCFRAFLGNHWLGCTMFVAVVVDFAIRAHAWPRRLY